MMSYHFLSLILISSFKTSKEMREIFIPLSLYLIFKIFFYIYMIEILI
jgi:hypothetical protein